MPLIRNFFRLIGKIIGWTLEKIYNAIKKLFFYLVICLLFLSGILLTFFGNILLIVLTFICSLFILFLKGFSWLTVKTLGLTKDFGENLGEWTEGFFEGITDVFAKEEQELEQQLIKIKIEMQ